jgi:rubrerythrin
MSAQVAAPDELDTRLAAGTRVKGQYRCADCGYGVTIYTELPLCPMCGAESWEQIDWSPFGRGRSRPAEG